MNKTVDTLPGGEVFTVLKKGFSFTSTRDLNEVMEPDPF